MEFFYTNEGYGKFKIQRTDTLWIFFKQVQYGEDYVPWVKVGFNAVQGNETHIQAFDRFLATQPELFV